MNRYQRLMREAQDNMLLLEDEHRDLGRKYETVVAENKRLRFQIYGEHKRFGDAMVRAEERAVDERAVGKTLWKVDTYFDVLNWTWVAFTDIKVRL